MLWVPLAVATWITFVQAYPPRSPDWQGWVLVIPVYFAVAVLCGMAIRRSITAVVIALVLGLAVTIPLLALVTAHMLPAPALLLVPLGVLVVSWGWSADWLFDRPAPGRGVRLGLLVAAMLGLVTSSYASYRAWGVPDVGPIPPPRLGSRRQEPEGPPNKMRPISIAKQDAGWSARSRIRRRSSNKNRALVD